MMTNSDLSETWSFTITAIVPLILKAVLPLILCAAGAYAVITGKTHLGTGPEDGPPLDRPAATALGMFFIGCALILHVHYSWSAKPNESVWTKAVKFAAALVSLGSIAFFAIHLGAFGRT